MQIIELNLKPEVAYWRLKDCRQPFWLDSGKGDTERSRYSFIGAGAVGTYIIENGEKALYLANPMEYSEKGSPAIDSCESRKPLELLRDILRQRKLPCSHGYTKELQLPFISGGVGYLSYEARHLIEKLPSQGLNDAPIPWARFDFYDWCYAYDHHQSKGYLVTPYEGYNLTRWLKQLEIDEPMVLSKGPFIDVEPVSNMSKATYEEAIAAIKEYISSGDIYQMNMTQRFFAPAIQDARSLYYHLRSINPAPFGAYLTYPEFEVLCCSPERFIRVQADLIETRPIKGTVPRSSDPLEDQNNITWLKNSEKDRSELLMIVDLERNDLSKVAAKGSVQVPELFVIESYPTVHHLVSTVTAKLREDKDLVDVIQATFPGGSITGTPKIRAMEIIDSLEPTARNLYTGAIGYLSDFGDLDLNIVIRTIVHQNQNYYYQVGGGIVWDSQTQSEYEECFHKGKALVRALWGEGSFT